MPGADGEWPTAPVEVVSRLDFGYGTNNEAEYRSLIAGLADITPRIEAAGQQPSAWQIEVRGDSDLVLKQLERAGPDSYDGFIHADRNGKKSLVYDAIEEFRPLMVDRAVATMFKLGEEVKRSHDVHELLSKSL